MGRNINTGTLNKDYVLSKVSQITIFSTYLNLSDAIVQHCIDTGDFILSPIRYDVNPTCGFKYDFKNKLKFKDFAGYFWGDCFDLVALVMSSMYKTSINISNKEDFIKVLRHITLMFKDIFYGQDKDINLITDINTTIVNLRNTKPVIELVVRSWNNDDIRDWGKIGVSVKDLNIEFIYAIDQYYINKNINPDPKYYYKSNDPCYGYVIGQDREGVYNIKLYFPKREKGFTRFITNCNHLEGIYTLDKVDYDIILVTKSTKDRVAIKSAIKHIKLLYGQDIKANIGVINLPHETYKLRQSEYDWLKGKLNPDGVIVSLMDNDRVGKLQSIWLLNNFNILPLLIPIIYKCKDFAEWREKQGIKNITQPIINIINNIKEYEKRSINKQQNKHNKLIRFENGSDASPF